MEEPGRARRSPGAACALLATLVTAVALLGACSSDVPRAADPLVSAHVGPPPLPPNIGPSDCQPPSAADPLDGGSTEIHGAASVDASLWAKVAAARPFPSGQDLVFLWRMPGSSALHLVAVSAGQRVQPTQIAPTTAPGWDRPGDAWTSRIRFPSAGCWRINASRGQAHGDVWVQVS
jgi:hypothetical protein